MMEIVASHVHLGRVHGNRMIDLAAPNEKLRDRAARLLIAKRGLRLRNSQNAARTRLEIAGGVGGRRQTQLDALGLRQHFLGEVSIGEIGKHSLFLINTRATTLKYDEH